MFKATYLNQSQYQYNIQMIKVNCYNIVSMLQLLASSKAVISVCLTVAAGNQKSLGREGVLWLDQTHIELLLTLKFTVVQQFQYCRLLTILLNSLYCCRNNIITQVTTRRIQFSLLTSAILSQKSCKSICTYQYALKYLIKGKKYSKINRSPDSLTNIPAQLST